MSKLSVRVVSQERSLIETHADSVTVDTSTGQITILPGHVPLFGKLVTGEVQLTNDSQTDSVVVSKGFLHVTDDNSVTIMADVATQAREISLQKAQEAVKNAEKTLSAPANQREKILAEAALRKALLEIKVAQRSRSSRK